MKIWHKYLREENLLTYGRYLVYKGGLKVAPGAGESAEAGREVAGGGEKPPTLGDVNAKLESAKVLLRRIAERYGKKMREDPNFEESRKKFAEVNKKVKEIEKKIHNLEKQKVGKRQEVIDQVNSEIDNIIRNINSKWPGEVKVRPSAPKPVEKPKSSSEGAREKVPTRPKEKLSHLLGKVFEGGYDSFQKHKGEIVKILKSLDIKPGRQDQVAWYDLPGGFSVGHVNWSKADDMPNFAIFKDGKTICFMQDTGNGKSELMYARELGRNERPPYNRRMVELMKYNVMLPKALAQVTNHPKTKNIIFSTPSALNDFKTALIGMAKMSKFDNKPGWDWEAMYGGKTVQFDRKGTSMDGKFRIQVGNNVMYFDTTMPNHIGLEQAGENGKKEVLYRSDSDFLFTPKEQKQNDKRQAMLKTRRAKEQEKKRQEEARGKAEKARAQKEAKRMLRGRVNKLINPKFKNLVKASEDDPKSFTVKAGEKDKKGLNLINNTPIHKLLALEKSKTEVILITIKGAPGKPPRKAMYYPGQKTAYEVNSKGKQTNNRIKFYNGDTISLNFKEPEANDYANLNMDKDKNRVFPVERIEASKLFTQLKENVMRFKEKGGKLSDLNLKPLRKYIKEGYNPKIILTGKNWDEFSVKKLGYKKAMEILKTELTVIKAGLVKLSQKNPFYD